MILVLSDPRYGSNLSNVEASLKKHEAISADIMSREDRFQVPDLTDYSVPVGKKSFKDIFHRRTGNKFYRSMGDKSFSDSGGPNS
jgi:hypothetical protein